MKPVRRRVTAAKALPWKPTIRGCRKEAFVRYSTTVAAFALVFVFAPAGAQSQAGGDKAAFDQASIARYRDMFAAQDFNRSGQVTREEVHGNVEFTAVFDDIDIDRDGIVTRAELDRYLATKFGAAAPR
jgi:hypothetical protein